MYSSVARLNIMLFDSAWIISIELGSSVKNDGS